MSGLRTDVLAAERSGDSADQAQERGQALAAQARERAWAELERRTGELGNHVGVTAEDLWDVAEHLRSQGKDGPARVAEQTAERVSRVGEYLKRTEGDQLLADVEDMGRERPLVVIAGGAALGLAASRFLKASSSERYRASRARSTGDAARPTGTPEGMPHGL